jgi:N6-adenosine-specific RNA methylase IME4
MQRCYYMGPFDLMHASPPFDTLRMFGYDIIYADPPWSFDNYSEKGEGRNAKAHYDCMTLDQIKALPVHELASGDCALFLWVTDPLLDVGIETLKHWGFRYVTKAFTFVKLNRSGEGYFMSTGYYTRANDETCLLGMMGSLPRIDAGVRQLVVEPVREHSRKPDRIADDIVRLFGDRPRVELFARTRREGWDAWGNETGKFEVEA